jgi:hypothetical protein
MPSRRFTQSVDYVFNDTLNITSVVRWRLHNRFLNLMPYFDFEQRFWRREEHHLFSPVWFNNGTLYPHILLQYISMPFTWKCLVLVLKTVSIEDFILIYYSSKSSKVWGDLEINALFTWAYQPFNNVFLSQQISEQYFQPWFISQANKMTEESWVSSQWNTVGTTS